MSTVAIAGIASSAIGATGSIIAGSEQAGAAKTAAQLQAQEQEKALAFQEKVWGQEQANEAPYIKAGGGAIDLLSQLTSKPGEGLLTPWTGTFKAPTAAEAEATPGYQFQLSEGERALGLSAAASGGLLTGGTLKGIENYAQGLASTNYQNVFQNKLQEYQTAYNTFEANQANTYARLAGVAQGGQQAVTTTGQLGQSAATNTGNIFLTGGEQIGRDIMGGAAATASGYAGATNAAMSGINNIGSIALLQGILNAQQNAQLPSPYAGAPYEIPDITSSVGAP